MRTMLVRHVTAALLILAAAAAPAAGQGLVIGADVRTELLTIIYRLAGSPEYSQCRVPAYAAAIDSAFAPFRQHPAVQLARRLRQRQGLGFDGVMSFAIHLTSATAPEARLPWGGTLVGRDPRWRDGAADSMLAAVQSFAREADVARFFAAHQPLYDSAGARMRRLVEANVDLPWFERFFGARPAAAFHVAPNLCNGGGNFGPRVQFPDGREELYAIIGTERVDAAGWPDYPTGFVGTIVHEFAHSFVNPVLIAQQERFAAAGPLIHAPVAAQMSRQAYGTWGPMFYESFVRAAVVHYIRDHRDSAAAAAEIRAQHARGFLWTGELVQRLADWQRRRREFPTLAAYLPTLAPWWDSLATRADAMRRDYDRRRPQLVRSTPRVGDDAVDPDLATLSLTFDLPMLGGYSVNVGPGGREALPPIDSLRWDEARTTLTVFVRLAPGRDWSLVLNGPLGGGFQSTEGVALAETAIRFRTRAR